MRETFRMSELPRNSVRRFAYAGLDRLFHEHARLSVLSSLLAHRKGLSFGTIRNLCALTDGNLSRHLEVLESAGLIRIVKVMESNRPQTLCRITASGRQRFLAYLSVLEQVLHDAENASEQDQKLADSAGSELAD
jgi:DNA-binding MarR family transcriptional regulator